MKRIITLLCILCTLTQAYAWKPLFAGHRGSYRGVENTEEAFLNGLNHYGYTGLECDVKTTSDGVCVCWHDDDLSRVGHEDVSIPNSKWEDIKDLTLTQTRSGVTYTGKLCSVDRFLEICKENNAFPIIELKWANGINNNDMSRFSTLYKLIEKHELIEEARILTSMQKSLEYIRTNYPALQCQFLCYEVTEARYEWCTQWGINPSVQKGGLTKDMANKCHKAGLQVAVWTINNSTDYQKHGELGCYMMTCDYLVAADMPELPEVDWGIINDPEYIPVTEILLTPTETTVAVGDTAYIQATIAPTDATNQEISWRYTPTNRNTKLKKNGFSASITSKTEKTFTVTATIDDITAACIVHFTQATDVQDLELPHNKARKIIQNGQLSIQHNQQQYTILGQPK